MEQFKKFFASTALKSFDNEAEHRRLLQLLQGILIIFIPFAAIILILRRITMPNNEDATGIMMLNALIVIGIIYLVVQTRKYYLTMGTTMFLGYLMIVTNALNASAPHIEIAYIVILPLFATVMFTFRETLIISGITIVVAVVFLFNMNDIENDIMYDLLMLISLTLIFIVFAAYQWKQMEHNRQQLALKQNQAAILQQLLSNISHDLRTPIATINTSAYILERLSDNPRQLERIERIKQQSNRLNHLIEDMFTMSQLDLATEPEQVDWVDVSEVVGASLEQSKSLAEQRDITITLNVGAELPKIWMNWDALHRIVANLLNNAIIYNQAGGTVAITINTAHEQLIIEIKDTGQGIAAENLPYIFDRFYRVDKARSTQTGGSGLGLAIVKRTIEMYKGDIEVQSTLNHGTTFMVTLPIKPPAKKSRRNFFSGF